MTAFLWQGQYVIPTAEPLFDTEWLPIGASVVHLFQKGANREWQSSGIAEYLGRDRKVFGADTNLIRDGCLSRGHEHHIFRVVCYPSVEKVRCLNAYHKSIDEARANSVFELRIGDRYVLRCVLGDVMANFADPGASAIHRSLRDLRDGPHFEIGDAPIIHSRRGVDLTVVGKPFVVSHEENIDAKVECVMPFDQPLGFRLYLEGISTRQIQG